MVQAVMTKLSMCLTLALVGSHLCSCFVLDSDQNPSQDNLKGSESCQMNRPTMHTMHSHCHTMHTPTMHSHCHTMHTPTMHSHCPTMHTPPTMHTCPTSHMATMGMGTMGMSGMGTMGMSGMGTMGMSGMGTMGMSGMGTMGMSGMGTMGMSGMGMKDSESDSPAAQKAGSASPAMGMGMGMGSMGMGSMGMMGTMGMGSMGMMGTMNTINTMNTMGTPSCSSKCYESGHVYEQGDTWTRTCDCQTCECEAGGVIECHPVCCPEPECPACFQQVPEGECCAVCKGCKDSTGTWHHIGDVWSAGCHQYKCLPCGTIVQTSKASDESESN